MVYACDMPYPELSAIFFGIIGGVIRALVGYLKTIQFRKPRRFNYYRVGVTAVIAGLIGLMAGVLAQDDWRFAILAGYAGSDFIEGLARWRFRKRV